MELVKFKELEERIKGLVEEHNTLKKRTKELEELVAIKSGELKEANGTIAKLNEERDSVRHKVDTLLDLLEDINASEQTSGLLFEKKV